MPDTREKLIELLSQVQYQGNAVHGYSDKYIQNGELADHLIANGVTVKEWISVKERLPTETEDKNHRIVGVVNGYNGKIKFTDAEIFVRYSHEENAWWSDDYDIEGCTVEKFYVLPEPQKGD